MIAEQILINANLWDHAALSGRARAWCASPEGKWFSDLKPSQLSGLERSLSHTRGRDGFLEQLSLFADADAERGKGQTTWTPERVEALTVAFREALDTIRKSTGKLASAYAECKQTLNLDQAAERELDMARDEAVLRGYLATLSMIHRSREKEAK